VGKLWPTRSEGTRIRKKENFIQLEFKGENKNLTAENLKGEYRKMRRGGPRRGRIATPIKRENKRYEIERWLIRDEAPRGSREAVWRVLLSGEKCGYPSLSVNQKNNSHAVGGKDLSRVCTQEIKGTGNKDGKSLAIKRWY